MVSYGQNLLFLKKSVNYFLDIMKDAFFLHIVIL